MKIGNIYIPKSILLLVLGIVVYSLTFMSTPLLFLFLIVVLLISIKLVSFPFQPGVIFFIFLFHWIQIAFTIFAAMYADVSINEISWAGSGEAAIWCSGIGLIFLALGYRYWLRKNVYASLTWLKKEAGAFRFNRVLWLYAAFFVLNLLMETILFRVPAVTQLLIRLVALKWVFLYLLIYISILRKEHYSWVIAILVFEFILGFSGYFSGFKDIVFYLLIALIPLISRLATSYIVVASIGASLLFSLAISWQAIKGDYRDFLSQGARTQSVVVSREEALDKVQKLFAEVSPALKQQATQELLERVAYTKFIALVMDYVPTIKKHEGGALWLENFSFVLVPRFLNPEKGIKDDSEKTNKYTGLRFSTRQEGTSISIGYFGEAYIDFGYIGMMFMVAFIGFLVGGLFYLFYNYTQIPIIVKHGFLNVIFFDYYNFGNDGIVVAGLLTINLVYYFIIYLVLLRPLVRFIYR